MRRTDALKRTLESLSSVYNDGSSVPVEFDKPSRATPDHEVKISPNVREELGRDLSGPQELRCIANTLSHEIEHLRESDLTSKEEFMDEYPEHRQFAGAVINILEDQYIDHTRTQRYPGLRKAQAFVVDALMSNHHRRPRVDNLDHPVQRYQETLLQVAFAGYAKGISNADDDLREFAARVRPIIEEVRREPDQDARKNLAHRCMDIAQEYLPDGQDTELPDECAVCGEREPVVIVPLLGPVCRECAPTGHGPQDGTGSGEKPDPEDLPDDLSADDFERVESGSGDVDAADLPDHIDPEDIPEADDRRGSDAGSAGFQRGGDGDESDGGSGGGPDGEGDEADGEGGSGPGDGDGDESGAGSGGGPGDRGGDTDDGPGEQSPISNADDERQIDPREWDWLDLDGHEGHTVTIVDDDAEV